MHVSKLYLGNWKLAIQDENYLLKQSKIDIQKKTKKSHGLQNTGVSQKLEITNKRLELGSSSLEVRSWKLRLAITWKLAVETGKLEVETGNLVESCVWEVGS